MQLLYETMQKLVALHEELVQISNHKTEEIKQGDMDKLSQLLMQERKQVQAINQAESARQKIVEDLFTQQGADDQERTMSNLLVYMECVEDKERFERIMSSLIDIIIKLREVEKLNQDLMAQSMQFVQLSLDMLQPSIQRMNYDGKQGVQESPKQSVFDSKA